MSQLDLGVQTKAFKPATIKLLLVIVLAIFAQVPLSFSDAGSDCSDCVSQKAGASKVLCGSLYYRSHQRSRACSTPSTFSCCSTTPAFSVHNDDSLADLSSSSNKSFAALRASSSIPYISGGGGGRQAKRASVNEPPPEFPEQLKDFLFRSGRIKVVECGDGHCGIRCFVRHGNQAIGNEMHAANQSHVSGGRIESSNWKRNACC